MSEKGNRRDCLMDLRLYWVLVAARQPVSSNYGTFSPVNLYLLLLSGASPLFVLVVAITHQSVYQNPHTILRTADTPRLTSTKHRAMSSAPPQSLTTSTHICPERLHRPLVFFSCRNTPALLCLQPAEPASMCSRGLHHFKIFHRIPPPHSHGRTYPDRGRIPRGGERG